MGILDKLFKNKDLWFDNAVEAYQRRDFEEAARLFLRVVKTDPADYGAIHSLAYSYLMLKDYEGAIKYFLQFQRIAPAEEDNEHLRSLLGTLEEALSVNRKKADRIVHTFLEDNWRRRNEATVGGKKVTSRDLVNKVNELLLSNAFRQSQTVRRFSSAMSGKIPLCFYSIEGLENIDVEDAFHFGLGFIAGGYAIAKASKRLLTEETYGAQLPQGVLRRLVLYPPDKGIPVTYDEDLIKVSNPIPWRLVGTLLDTCVNAHLDSFMSKMGWTKAHPEEVRTRLVREFVYIGYFAGLRENALEYEETGRIS